MANLTGKKTYKVAVIGCGYIGAGVEYFNKKIQPATHAGAFDANPRFKLVALVDNDPKKLEDAKKHFPKARVYTDIKKMILTERPDVVSVASPTPLHFDHVMTLAKLKVPLILSEKPLADRTDRAKKMIEACRKSGSKLFVNYQRHFDPIIKKWSEKISKREFGRLYQGNVYYYNGLYNNAGHMIDLLNMFFGKPKEVSARFNRTTETEGKGFNADGIMIYKNDLLITLQSLTKNYGHFSFQIFGEDGAMSITKNVSPVIEFRKKVPNKEAKKYFELSDKVMREGKSRSTLAPTINYLVDYLDGHKKEMCTGEDALVVMQVLDALKESAEKNGKVIKVK